jgi:hypothetical protein
MMSYHFEYALVITYAGRESIEARPLLRNSDSITNYDLLCEPIASISRKVRQHELSWSLLH